MIKCPVCNDTGRFYRDGGIVDIPCPRGCPPNPNYKGGDYIPPKPKKEEPPEATATIQIGLFFQLAGEFKEDDNTAELWEMCKQEMAEKTELPYEFGFLCGKRYRFTLPESITSLPIEDVPCDCGDPSHMVVKFEDNRVKAISLSAGEYYCTKCNKAHREASKIGKRHLAFKKL